VGSVFGWRNRRDGHGDPAGFVPHSGPAIDASDPWLCVRGGEAGLRERGGLRKPGAGGATVRWGGTVASAGPERKSIRLGQAWSRGGGRPPVGGAWLRCGYRFTWRWI